MNRIQESENYLIVGKEFCNLFDKYGRIDEINKDFANKMSSVLGSANW